MKIDQLPPEFFEYIFMNNGDAASVAAITGIPQETVQKIHDDFAYWYPVDLRTSGKDLVANHLLFFLYHHVAIFPERLWPKAIAVNGFVSLEGKKMSKSKGPILTLRQAVAENGADVTRLYILGNAEGTADVDWRNDAVEATYAHLERFYNLAREILADSSIDESAEKTLIDRWMLSRLQRRIAEATQALENIQTRRALQNAFYLLFNDLRWYQRRGGKNQLRAVLGGLGAHDVALHAPRLRGAVGGGPGRGLCLAGGLACGGCGAHRSAGGEGGGPAGADAEGRAGDCERYQSHAHEDHALHCACLEEGDAAPRG